MPIHLATFGQLKVLKLDWQHSLETPMEPFALIGITSPSGQIPTYDRRGDDVLRAELARLEQIAPNRN